MLSPLMWGAFEQYWTTYHTVTFDGINKLIYINQEIYSLDVEIDIYSSWKEWAQIDDNLKYLAALRTTGGDPLPGGRRVGQYFFLINGWKMVPPASTLQDIEIVGNLFTEDGSDVFIDASARGIALIRQVVSQFTEIAQPTIASGAISVTVSGSGLTVDEGLQLDALMGMNSYQTASLDYLTSLNNAQTGSLNELLISGAFQTITLVSQSTSLNTIVNQNVELSSSVQNLQTDINTLLVAGGSLTPSQSVMLLEMYRILGLDPTKPLVVTPDARSAGVEVSQSISKVGSQVTVTRDP